MNDINNLRRLALDGDFYAIHELLDRIEAAEKERDELLNALEPLSKMAEAFPSELHEKHPDVVAARAAIARATGEQP